MSNADKLQFQYSSKEFSDDSLGIQLIFENPNEVSLIPYDLDYLVIELENFRDQKGELIADYHTTRTALPNQIDENSTAFKVLETFGDLIVVALGVTVSFSFALSYLMNASLQQLLSLVKNLQLVSHIPLLSVFVPAITLGFFEIIFKALRFDLFEVSEYTQQMFGLSEEEADEAEFDGELTSEAELESRLAQLGYESGFMPINFGTLLYILLVQMSITILLVVFQLFLCSIKCRNWVHKKIDGIFFNSIITVIDSEFLLFAMTATINVKLVA